MTRAFTTVSGDVDNHQGNECAAVAPDSSVVMNQFRWADIGVILAIIVQLFIVVWYASQLDARVGSVERQLSGLNTAQLDTRVGVVERQQTVFSNSVANLDAAREKADIHMTQIDDKLENMNGKIQAILDIVERMEQNTVPMEASPVPGPTPSLKSRPPFTQH